MTSDLKAEVTSEGQGRGQGRAARARPARCGRRSRPGPGWARRPVTGWPRVEQDHEKIRTRAIEEFESRDGRVSRSRPGREALGQ